LFFVFVFVLFLAVECCKNHIGKCNIKIKMFITMSHMFVSGRRLYQSLTLSLFVGWKERCGVCVCSRGRGSGAEGRAVTLYWLPLAEEMLANQPV
jgi:hypothetical protein